MRVGLRAAHQRRAALDSYDMRSAPRDRQGEVAEAAKEVSDRSPAPAASRPIARRTSMRFIGDIDLGEIGRLELDAHAEIG